MWCNHWADRKYTVGKSKYAGVGAPYGPVESLENETWWKHKGALVSTLSAVTSGALCSTCFEVSVWLIAQLLDTVTRPSTRTITRVTAPELGTAETRQLAFSAAIHPSVTGRSDISLRHGMKNKLKIYFCRHYFLQYLDPLIIATPAITYTSMQKWLAKMHYCQIDGDSDELRVNSTICQKQNI